MEDRIETLYRKSLKQEYDYSASSNAKPGEYYSNYKTVLDYRRFAEMIISDCVWVLSSPENEHITSAEYEKNICRIREYFGITE
ncbi:MAG: hypothetical protein EBU90_14045 [Proteobacteria bacterium]|nr:hypothetical protein [Pseudomonadota bacterium]